MVLLVVCVVFIGIFIVIGRGEEIPDCLIRTFFITAFVSLLVSAIALWFG